MIRPTAGAILFAATTQRTIHLHPLLAFACGLLLAGGVHAVKAGARPALTAISAGTANPVVSTIEDAVSALTSLVSLLFPYLVVAWVALLILLVVLILRWRRQRLVAHGR